MDRERYVLDKIKEMGLTPKSFSKIAGIPYSTLMSMLDRGLGGASIDNVIKICNTLGISVDDLNHDVYSSTVREHESDYYVNESARALAKDIYENQNLRILFDASRKLDTDDLEFVIDFVNRLKKE